MIRRPPRSTLFPYNDALPICHDAQRTLADRGVDQDGRGVLPAVLGRRPPLPRVELSAVDARLQSDVREWADQEAPAASATRPRPQPWIHVQFDLGKLKSQVDLVFPLPV